MLGDKIRNVTEKCQYLTSKVNSLFSLKRHFMRIWEGRKEKLLTEIDKESSLVAEADQISNLRLIRDLKEVVDFLYDWESSHF